MSHWQLLGLECDADERAIKRAYARLLKIHRPDEDAEAFQQLREAYESALDESRWRAQWEADEDDYEVVTTESIAPAIALDAQLAATFAPVEAAAPEPLQAAQEDFSGYLEEAAEPDIPLGQLHQWLDEGNEESFLRALPGLLASDWLLSFDRRQWFEEQVLSWLEESGNWSAHLFDQTARLMGWDDAKGHLPCDGPRWRHLLDLRATAFELDALRHDLHGRDPEAVPAFLFKPQSDTERRRLADGFEESDWDHCQQMACRFEQHSPAQLERVGLVVANDWRNWLPRSGAAFCVYLWLLACCLMAVKHVPSAQGWTAIDVIRVVTSALLGAAGSVWVYVIWRRIAMWLTVVDVPVSRLLLSARLYRHGAGLLVLRHVLPCAALSALAAWQLRDMAPAYWAGPVLAFGLLLYLADGTLRGTIPAPWARMYQAMTKPTDETGW